MKDDLRPGTAIRSPTVRRSNDRTTEGEGWWGDDESHILLTNNSAAQFVKNARKKVVVDEECWATLELLLLKTSRRFGVR